MAGSSSGPSAAPAADASVRQAAAPDAAAIAAVQVRAWRAAYPDLLDEPLDALDPEVLASSWQAAVVTPPSPAHTVLVACAGDAVVGFAAAGRSDDRDAGESDGQVAVLAVDPDHQRRGHGSRLLAASTDHLRRQGLTSVSVWTPDVDGPRRDFLTSAGLVADGARRRLSRDGVEVTELRYAASLDRAG